MCPSNPTRRHGLGKWKHMSDICKQMVIATLFIIANNWKPCRSPLTGEWINKLWYIHTECYEVAFYCTIDARYSIVELNYIMLSEEPDPKGYIWYESHMWHSGKGETTGTDIRCGCQGMWWREGMTTKGPDRALCKERTISYLTSGGGYKTVHICQNSQACTLKT